MQADELGAFPGRANTMLTCRELIDFLDQFIADELEQATANRFREHLMICPDCRAYLDSYRKTIALARLATTPEAQAPDEVPASLLNAVREAMCQK